MDFSFVFEFKSFLFAGFFLVSFFHLINPSLIIFFNSLCAPIDVLRAVLF